MSELEKPMTQEAPQEVADTVATEQPAEVEGEQDIQDVHTDRRQTAENLSRNMDNENADKIAHTIEEEGSSTETKAEKSTAPGITPEQAKKPAEQDLVETIKAEGESFMNEFNKAKGMEKIGVLMEKFGELTEKLGDSLLKIGRPMLLQFAKYAEQFGILSKPWVDRLRELASSERAILQEMLKEKDFVLVRDINKKNDTTALDALKKMHKAKAEEVAILPPAATPAPDAPATPAAATDAAPATAPSVTPPKPTEVYTFEQYVADVVKEAIANRNWDQKIANEEGKKQLTLTEIVSTLS